MTYDTDHTLKFASEYVDKIRNGTKTATVRYRDERDVSPGDTILAVDAETVDTIAVLRVKAVAETEVRDAVDMIEAVGGSYHTVEETAVVDGLNEHYDDDIGPLTIVDTYVFEVVSVLDVKRPANDGEAAKMIEGVMTVPGLIEEELEILGGVAEYLRGDD